MTHEKMLEGFRFILAAQGFKNRLDQYKSTKRVNSENPIIGIRLVSHRYTSEKFVMKMVPLDAPASVKFKI